jgi:ribosomal protein S18 acetylase RimI-like enzyme
MNDQIQMRTFLGRSDYAAIHNLFQICQKHDLLVKVLTEEILEFEMSKLPNFIIDKQLQIIESRGNADVIGTIAYNWRSDSLNNYIYEFHNFLVNPDWRGKTLETDLLLKAENWLVDCSREHNTQSHKWLQIRIQDTQSNLIKTLENFGYSIHRTTIKMTRDINQALPDVIMPTGIIIRPPKKEEYQKVLEANDEANRDLWGYSPKTKNQFNNWEKDRLFQPECWQVAWAGDQVAGMILGYIDTMENNSFSRKRGYTEEIGVLRPWRRMGLAKSLLTHSIKMFKKIGMEETALSVDSKNQFGAYQFYLGMGYKPENEFLYFRKEIISE